MKTEKQIAEQYTKDLKKYEKPDGRWHIVNRTCHEHKFACQRFLEFLENLIVSDIALNQDYKDKITDLKQAIKLYNEAGIK